MFLLLYFIFRSVAAYRTVIVAMRCHCFNKPLSIYLFNTLYKFPTWAVLRIF